MNYEEMTKLGYTMETHETSANFGVQCHVIIKDSEGNEVVHETAKYGNESGRYYALLGAKENALATLEDKLTPSDEEKEDISITFLCNLYENNYIEDFGELGSSKGTYMILFDTWEQLRGTKDNPSVWAKLQKLSENNLLKPSVKYTVDSVETGFTDSFRHCDGCGKIFSTEWNELTYIEDEGMYCDDCINSDETGLAEVLIEQAKGNFKQAVKPSLDEKFIIALGYEKVDEEDFSTRCLWGENSWSCHNTHPDTCEKICNKYNGIAKITCSGMFEDEYNMYFPTGKVEMARKELGLV